MEEEVSEIRMTMRGEMVADEKKQERNVDKLHEEMRMFKEEMILWRQDFAKEVKKYEWKTSWEVSFKGEYRGRGEN